MVFKNLYHNQQGVTLVELLIGMGIFAFLVVGITALFLSSRKYTDIVWEQLKTQNEGRKVIQDFVNEIRTASQSSIGAYPVAAASSTEIIFYTNLDTDTLMERVRYFFSGTILKKGVIKPTGNPLAYVANREVITEVAHDVVASTSKFIYYGSNYPSSSTPLISPINVTSIRMAGIMLTLEEDPNASPVPFSIESKVSLRNLKDN